MIEPAKMVTVAVTARQLLRLSLAPAACRFKRQILQVRLRSLRRMAEYFEWQEANGRAGLADTHKRMALVQSELHSLNSR